MKLRSSKGVAVVLAVIFLAGGGYWISRFLGFSGNIPSEFTQARLQGALIAQNIVNLSNQSALDLVEINKYDQSRNLSDALNLTNEVIQKGQEIREEAVQLSRQIEIMTTSLSEIRSTAARQAALESITNRLALISRLINYSGHLGQLLETLRAQFTGELVPKGRSVSILVDQINAEVRAINAFDNQATQAMERFDTIVSGK